MTEFVQILTTVDSQNIAKRIANELLVQRVASCVQMYGPVKSSYWWKGKIEKATEWYCLAKTTRKNYHNAELMIKKLHPYDIPEILAIPVLSGNLDYLKWIQKTTGKNRSVGRRR